MPSWLFTRLSMALSAAGVVNHLVAESTSHFLDLPILEGTMVGASRPLQFGARRICGLGLTLLALPSSSQFSGWSCGIYLI